MFWSRERGSRGALVAALLLLLPTCAGGGGGGVVVAPGTGGGDAALDTRNGDVGTGRPENDPGSDGGTGEPADGDRGGVDSGWVEPAVYDDPYYCRPCLADEDCNPSTEEGAAGRCYGPVEGAEAFCGPACDRDTDCPEDAICVGRGAAGTELGVCRPVGEPCGCTQESIDAGASTGCISENEHGRCAGLVRCSEQGLSGCDARVPAPEVCNAEDDDCDGESDEGFALGEPCDGGDSDLCANGVTVCAEDGAGVVCAPEDPSGLVETCNGEDDDCDGETDEGFSLGEACDGPDSDLCALGTWTCAGDGEAECVNETESDRFETCNGIDDDCDTRRDEVFGVGYACDGPDSDLCAHGVFECGPDGLSASCGVETQTDLVETCNGEDDDCDGETDEGFLDFDKDGAADCVDDDDDDDGVLDENDCEPRDAGVAPGLPERCNSIDENCDTVVDEGFDLGEPCDGDDEDLCENGVVVCARSGKGAICGPEDPEGISELCNGEDDDCDGEVDEGFHVGEPCDGPDDDLCAHGVLECRDDGTARCSDETKSDIKESCNAIDDDCDGETDEGFPVGEPCDGPDADECANGAFVCTADGRGVACPFESPADLHEVCNGEDDDCDGQTDEGFPGLGEPCDGPDPDSCENGLTVCTADGAGVDCSGDFKDDVEVCNGLDDDCDGQVDEGFIDLGRPCDGPDSDGCENGTWTCDRESEGLVCENEDPEGVPELCNLKDDDCDGYTDEDFDGLGFPCDGDDPDLCENGLAICTVDGTALECVSDEASPELCNGKDDDCDDLVDEDFLELGQACDGPDEDECVHGTWVCSQTGLMICEETGNVLRELCNGEDDDCDGRTDEGFAVGYPCDGDDADECELGTWACGEDQVSAVCVGDEGGGGAEVCNDFDDDCDGDTDEGFVEDPSHGADLPDEWSGQGIVLGEFYGEDTTPDLVASGTVEGSLVPSHDTDWFRLKAVETSSAVLSCNPLQGVPDDPLRSRLRASGGSPEHPVRFCVCWSAGSTLCDKTDRVCQTSTGSTVTFAPLMETVCPIIPLTPKDVGFVDVEVVHPENVQAVGACEEWSVEWELWD